MIDNEELKILTKDKDVLFAMYQDEKNVIVVQIVLATGTLFYNKAFSWFPIKNNFMGYVGSCKNTLN